MFTSVKVFSNSSVSSKIFLSDVYLEKIMAHDQIDEKMSKIVTILTTKSA